MSGLCFGPFSSLEVEEMFRSHKKDIMTNVPKVPPTGHNRSHRKPLDATTGFGVQCYFERFAQPDNIFFLIIAGSVGVIGQVGVGVAGKPTVPR